jgi:hypothetical protein
MFDICGELSLGDSQTSLAYSSQSVKCLYINHLLSVNNLVLSYITSTVVTPIRSYPLYCTPHYCTLTLTLTRRQPSALVALSFTFISDFVLKILQCILHRLQLSHSTYLLFHRLSLHLHLRSLGLQFAFNVVLFFYLPFFFG